MKMVAIAMVLMADVSAYGQMTLNGADHKVTVCMQDYLDRPTVWAARSMASKMFARIGVNVDWRHIPNDFSAECILISLNPATPIWLKPGALAYALPYEGQHIEVFYDRITRYVERVTVSTVLAHVLVHEITHILEGVARHSIEGIMKAHWNDADIIRMRKKQLEFAPEDVTLIQLGLASRYDARRLPPSQVNNRQSAFARLP